MRQLSGQLREASRVIRDGGVVAYPTEACFGLGCDPRNHAAVRRLLRIKHRHYAKGLILIAAEYRQLLPYVGEIDAPVAGRMMATWPGPETWIVPSRPGLSRLLTGEHESIAVRVTAHRIAAALCRHSRCALTSTSANFPGQSPLTDAATVRRLFDGHLDYVVDAPVGQSKTPSRIRDALSGQTLRH